MRTILRIPACPDRHQPGWRALLAPVVAALLIGVGGGCSSSKSKSSGVSAPASPGGASRTAAYVVGRRMVTFVDRSRPTPAVGGRPRQPQRTLRTELFYPAATSSKSGGTGVRVVDAASPVARTSPLLVFVPGIGSTPDDYRSHLVSWAAAGYVVAGVWLPVASGRGGSGADYGNAPEDVGFVITSMLGPADPVRAAVDPTEVAIAGHSIGGQTVLGHVYNSCCGDRRVGAVVAISGSELPFGGDWRHPPRTPLLLIHGERDGIVGFANSRTVLDTFPGPRALLAFPKGSHTSDLTGPSGLLIDAAVVAFLDHALRHDDAAWNALPARVKASGVAVLTTRGD